MGTAMKHPVSDRVKTFVIFDMRAICHSGLSVRVPGCQKLQMTANTDLCREGWWPSVVTGTERLVRRCQGRTVPSRLSRRRHRPGSWSTGCYGTRTTCNRQTTCITTINDTLCTL